MWVPVPLRGHRMSIRRVTSDSPRGVYPYLPSHVRTTRAELVGMGVRTWQWVDEGDRTLDADAGLYDQWFNSGQTTKAQVCVVGSWHRHESVCVRRVSQLHVNARYTYPAVCDLACAGQMRESGAGQRLIVVH